MTTTPLRLGQCALRGKQGLVILSSKVRPNMYVPSATVVSKAMKDTLPPVEKPAPWPYKEKGFSNLVALFEGTLKRFDENTVLITVEGPPAIGKSAFARQLAHDLDMLYLPMITADYQYIDHLGRDFRECDPLLPEACRSIDIEKFVKDPKHQNAASFQFLYQRLKFEQYGDALAHLFNTGQGVVIERCFWTDMAFMEANVRNGYNNKNEMKNYKKRIQRIDYGPFKPHLAIYLDARPEVVLENFKKRGLGEEKTFHLKYLQDLDDAHKSIAMPFMDKYSELLVYDWNEPGDAEAIVEDIERMNWDKYHKHDSKLKEWRWLDDREATQERWEWTQQKSGWVTKMTNQTMFDCPRLYFDGADNMALEEVRHKWEGYAPGYDPKLDKGILFKWTRRDPMDERLRENVTEMLLSKIPLPKSH